MQINSGMSRKNRHYPAGDYTKDAVERCLIYALETRRRVKEQLKKIGGMEFYDVHFSYIDQETLEEKFVSVPEQGGDTLIPDGQLQAGILYTVATGATASHLGLYRLETQMTNGNGKLVISGMGSNTQPKEAVKVAFDYFKANENIFNGNVAKEIASIQKQQKITAELLQDADDIVMSEAPSFMMDM